MYGQELQAESYAVARMNTIIHDMDVDLERGDTIINPKFRDATGSLMRFDIVVANPMWNQPFDPELFIDDPFDRFRNAGGATSGRGDWAWLQHTVATMNDGGRAAVVLDTGAVTRGSGGAKDDKERNIRQWFVDRDLVDGVILLPDNLFYNTSAAGVIVVLNKRKPASRKNKVVLVNASRRFLKGSPKNYLGENDIKGADYNLSPARWVSRSAAQGHRAVKEIVADLLELDERAKEIDLDLMKMLAAL
jgi:type I restriction enzyme M protein